MARRQTRRTISYSKELFADLQERAQQLGVPLASYAALAARRILADLSITASMVDVASLRMRSEAAERAHVARIARFNKSRPR
jgi:hypothetical protein